MEWITDRQPSPEDADSDGEVIMLLRADGRGNGAIGARDAYVDWRHVGPGVPWKHNPLLTPPAAEPELQPAPESVASDRPALAVGQAWMDRDGQVVTIEKYDPATSDGWPFWGSNGYAYRLNGRCAHDTVDHPRDLVKLISEAPEPAPASLAPEPPATVATASEFPEAIRSGAAPFYVVVTPDDSGGAGCGHLMAWEAGIPEGSTLESAWRRQAHIVRHYGTTYIAECRIVPSLTSGSPAQQLRPESGPVVTPPATATEPRQIRQLLRTRNPDGSHTLDAIDDGGVAWVLYPGTGRWEELIHLPARRVPAQQPQP